MSSNVDYSSFNPQLLVPVKEADPYVRLRIIDTSSYTKTGTCSPDNKTRYCNSISKKGANEGADQREIFHKLLDTPYNKVYIPGGHDMNKMAYGSLYGKNMPEESTNYPYNREALDLIKNPSLQLDSNNKTIAVGKSDSITYTYNGDGTVKCVSSDKTYVTCSVDKTNKKINIESLKKTDKNININAYATQGTNYSATSDEKITITSLSTTTNIVKGDVDGNGKVNTNDYLLIRKHLLKMPELTGNEKLRADVNSDDVVSQKDYILIRKIQLGLINAS